jgi:hypothetical protein
MFGQQIISPTHIYATFMKSFQTAQLRQRSKQQLSWPGIKSRTGKIIVFRTNCLQNFVQDLVFFLELTVVFCWKVSLVISYSTKNICRFPNLSALICSQGSYGRRCGRVGALLGTLPDANLTKPGTHSSATYIQLTVSWDMWLGVWKRVAH